MCNINARDRGMEDLENALHVARMQSVNASIAVCNEVQRLEKENRRLRKAAENAIRKLRVFYVGEFGAVDCACLMLKDALTEEVM